jgi:iron(III) transport system substrate-binding protein
VRRSLQLLAVLALVIQACAPASTPAPAQPAAGSSAAPAQPAGGQSAAPAQPASGQSAAPAQQAAASAAGQSLEQKLYEEAKKEGKFVWWYTSPAEEFQKFQTAFTTRYPGIVIEYTDANVGVHQEKFMLELQAKKVSVDGMSVQDFKSIREANAAADLSEIINDTGFKQGTADKLGAYMTHTVDGIAYNKTIIPESDAPKSWDDLLDPKYKGKMAIEDRLTAFIRWTDVPEYQGQRPGLWSEEKVVNFLSKLREVNNPRLMSSNTTMASSLAAGEIGIIAGVHMQSFRRLQDRGAPVEWAKIDSNIVDSSVHFVPKDAPHPNAARLFLWWSMSAEGQKIWDDIRGQGDPTPGSGTTQAAYLEKHGVTPFFSGAENEMHFNRLQKKYRDAIGAPS